MQQPMGAHLVILPDAVIYGAGSFYGGETRRHSGVILLSLGAEPIGVRTRTGSARGKAVLVAPSIARTLHAPEGRYLSIQIAPHHSLYRSLLRLGGAGDVLPVRSAGLRSAAERIAGSVWAGGREGELRQALASLALAVEAILPPEPWKDHRIQAIVSGLTAAAPGEYAFETLVRSSGLSPSRLSHAFSEAAGLSIRAFMQWRKTHEALRHISQRRNLTAVAHEAGFADSAHLSKTFHATLGLLPSQLANAQVTRIRTLAA
jgi:AraC-like DNA-binding protein